MLPRELQPAHFATYPPQAKALATAHIAVLQQLPLAFLPGLLAQLIEYDYKFPAEHRRLDEEFAALIALSPSQLADWFRGFSSITLSSDLEHIDWAAKPAAFLEMESTYLWTTRQMDAFRTTAISYGNRLRAAQPSAALPLPRLGIAVIGQGASTSPEPLFRSLRKYGTYFSQVKPEGGFEALLAAVEARAHSHAAPFSHWYIDGGTPVRPTPHLTAVSYASLNSVRDNLLTFMQREVSRPGMGPEQLRTDLAQLAPAQLGMPGEGDPVLDRFQVKLFTEGSGTQIFSTTFAQWTTREALRRAEPLTMLVRYAPRQRQKSMNELLNNDSDNEVDPAGSLIDADMAAYYHWLNQQRLSGAEQSSFLVWWEGHTQAVVIAPTLPRGVQSDSPMDLQALLKLATT
jgi:hypothetical protein